MDTPPRARIGGLPATLLLVGLSVSAPLSAIYVRRDLDNAPPLERLLANAAAQREKSPDDAHLVHTLARLHAMAYAWKLGDNDAVSATEENEPQFGYEPPWVPWTRGRQILGQDDGSEATGTPGQAQAHLEEAIRLYRRAVELDPDDPVARLGLAWTLREADRTDEARDLLRSVIEVAAPRELEQGGHLGPLLAVEAIDYLLPLLDDSSDQAEIDRLQELRARLEALPRAITPIVVGLRAGLRPEDLVDSVRPVRFDLDASGRLAPWSWIRPEVAAWLVYQRPGGEAVHSGLQLFGSRSFGLFFDDGYQALALLDDDGDGVLRGPELEGIGLWRDGDRDGIVDPGELVMAAQAGVVEIGCRHTDDQGIAHAPASVVLEGGRRLDTWDLVFETPKR